MPKFMAKRQSLFFCFSIYRRKRTRGYLFNFAKDCILFHRGIPEMNIFTSIHFRDHMLIVYTLLTSDTFPHVHLFLPLLLPGMPPGRQQSVASSAMFPSNGSPVTRKDWAKIKVTLKQEKTAEAEEMQKAKAGPKSWINVSTECLKWRLMLRMWESMLCQMMHVHFASDTQTIQFFIGQNDIVHDDVTSFPAFFWTKRQFWWSDNGVLICHFGA